MELYENLARLRKEAGLSQQDLAERLDVSRQSISKWELGTALPSMENLIGLSRLYGVSLDYLVGNSETRERVDTNSADTEEAPAEETPADGPPPDDSNSRGRGRRIVLERILTGPANSSGCSRPCGCGAGGCACVHRHKGWGTGGSILLGNGKGGDRSSRF